ncbi:MAG: FMN-binding negative transcriptional regulator [Brevundimonas sp.]|jgi:transcriptional regulator|uniref:FMN-binding negative transcriptional regulator n=1 Tax=Brevundimonas sp. TaxID=1871086 RepID=UPI00391C95F6
MYRPAAFAVDDPARLGALIKAHPLACLVAHGPKGLVAAHVPLLAVTDPDGRIVELIGHMARANPFWVEAGEGAEVLAVFTGPDAYVSPSMYPSKAQHCRVVPTWNYQRIEARGRLLLITEPSETRPYFEAPTDVMEAVRESAWSVDDAPEAYIRQLTLGVVGLRIALSGIEGVFKLSQNKSEADRAGVETGLAAEDASAARAVSKLMADTRGAA